MELGTWTKTLQGFCTEASSLGLKPSDSITKAVLPDGTTTMFGWLRHTSEGEVTHWTLNKGGVLYEVYND